MHLSVDDIILPSLLINFCRLFDIGNHIRFPIYYCQVLVAYMVSLLLAYTFMLTSGYQLCLWMFVYPCVIASTIITGLVRGELQKLLRGTLTEFQRAPVIERGDSF